MGQVDVTIQVSNLDQTKTAQVETMVDTGATYTFLPASTLKELGIVPHRTMTFRLADGRTVDYQVGRAIVQVNGFAELVAVCFGPDDIRPLLGVVTLEELGLGVDPVGNRLIDLQPTL